MRRIFLLTGWLIAALLFTTAAQNSWAGKGDDECDTPTAGWKQIKHDKRRHICVYLRKDSTERMSINRLTTRIALPLHNVLGTIYDFPNMTRWIWKLRESRMLKQVSPTEFYIYWGLNSPYGVADRDVIVHAKAVQDPKTRSVVITTSAVPDYMGPQPGYVRVQKLEMTFKMKVMDDGIVDVDLTGIIDPGGKIPVWASDMVQRDAFYTSFKGLIRVAQFDEYDNAKLPTRIAFDYPVPERRKRDEERAARVAAERDAETAEKADKSEKAKLEKELAKVERGEKKAEDLSKPAEPADATESKAPEETPVSNSTSQPQIPSLERLPEEQTAAGR